MRSALGTKLICGATVLLTAALPLSSIPAQVVLEIQQGTTWGNTLTMSALQTLHLRWKSSGTEARSAAWQLSYTDPASTASPTIVKSETTPVPSGAEYASFDIEPSALPAGAPASFYVRIRVMNGFSSWVPVRIMQRAAAPTVAGSQTNLSGLSPQVRAGATEIVRLPSTPPAPTAPPFIIPGGGGNAAAATPLWTAFKGFSCAGGDTGPVYAILATVQVNPVNVANSKVRVITTSPVKCDSQMPSPFYFIWGDDKAPIPITNGYWATSPLDAVMIAAVVKWNGNLEQIAGESPSSPRFLVKGMAELALINKLKGITGTVSSQDAMALKLGMQTALSNVLTGDGDLLLGVIPVNIPTDKLAKARAGEVVPLPRLEFKATRGQGAAPFDSHDTHLFTIAVDAWFEVGPQGTAPKIGR